MPSVPVSSGPMRSPQVLANAIVYTVLLLTGLGLVAIYAASSTKSAHLFANPHFMFLKQTASAGAGVCAIMVIRSLPIRLLERSPLPLLALALALLAAIFVPGIGRQGGGATRWITVAGIGYQPAELAKLAFIFFLAKNLSRPSCSLASARGLLPNLIVFAMLATLLMLQPDLGTTVLLFAILIGMLLMAGLPWKFFFGSVAAGILAGGAAILHAPYRLRRITSFLDPWADARNSGFQIIQSYLAYQNGGTFGSGLGESRQKFFFLPEAHSDFILAVIGEELGFVGVTVTLSLFLFLTFLGFRTARAQSQPFLAFVAYGLTFMLAGQTIINMGVCLGLLPTKGIPLPFVSSGTSSLFTSLVAAAVLSRLALDARGYPRDSAAA